MLFVIRRDDVGMTLRYTIRRMFCGFLQKSRATLNAYDTIPILYKQNAAPHSARADVRAK